jgi:NAD(P)-dependent dehydrogenase (short-subunit alcohol dehydrogenase family)
VIGWASIVLGNVMIASIHLVGCLRRDAFVARGRDQAMALTRTFIVTGGNSGLGFECASVLAKDSEILVIIGCRDVQKGKQAAQRVRDAGGNVAVLPLDLASQASVRTFIDMFRQGGYPPLAGIICNAGEVNVAAPTRTKEGYERTFGVNHLGHYLLTRLLLPELSNEGRITFVSSGTHDPEQKTGMPAPRYATAKVLAHDFEPGMQAGQHRYTASKLCNIYCTYEYARRFAALPDPRLQSLRVNAFDPGLMPTTGLARTYSLPIRFVFRYIVPALSLFVSNIHSPATSGRRLALLASGGEGPTTGKYFSDGREIRSSVESYDTRNALDLWNTSAEMTGLPSEL